MLARDRQRFVVLFIQDQARESFRAGDVGTLADVDEQRVVVDREWLQSGQPHRLRHCRNLAWRDRAYRFGDSANMVWRSAAAAADELCARLEKLSGEGSHVLR